MLHLYKIIHMKNVIIKKVKGTYYKSIVFYLFITLWISIFSYAIVLASFYSH